MTASKNKLKRFYRFFTIIGILGIHLFIAIFAFYFWQSEKSSHQSDIGSQNQIIFAANASYLARIGQNFVKLKVSDLGNFYFVDQTFPDFETLKVKIPNISKTHNIVLMIGVAEFESDDQIKSLLNKIPPDMAIFWLFVPPVDSSVKVSVSNTEISEFNQKMNNICAAQNNCSYIDLTKIMSDENGNLKKNLHTGDGIELNQNGFKIIEITLNSLVAK